MAVVIKQRIGAEPASDRAADFMVPMRDGIKLSTHLYLPGGGRGAGKTYSAILSRTPYDKSSLYTAIKFEAEYYNSRGFAFVAQDVRGKYFSEGETDPYTYDVQDGYDTVEWIVCQPWSNGKVGLTGASYYGFTVWAGVASGHPAIKAAVPQVTGIEMGSEHVGSRWSSQVPYLAGLNDLLQIWTTKDNYLLDISYDKASIPDIIAEVESKIGRSIGASWLLERSKSQIWYNPYGDRHPYYTTHVPVLHWQNWYDPGLAPSGLRDWRHFRQDPSLRSLHYLRIDSADHSGFRLENVGKGSEHHAYHSEAALQERIATEYREQADFFDEHLNRIKPAKPRSRAKWHIGHYGWQETEEYPPASQPRVFHLSARRENKCRALVSSAPDEACEATWTHDPKNPVPSTTDMETLWFLLAGYPDEQNLQDRKDILTFRTAPLMEDLVFAGQPELSARVSFSSKSTYIFAKLQDVSPDNTTRPISWGRCVLHKDTSEPLELAMDDNAYRVRPGNCLQLQVQSSDFPLSAVHPGTEENPFLASEFETVDHSIVLGGVDGATLTIPEYKPTSPAE
ncbi:hypothetical protein ACJ41O_015041 [Fusarium nematophilum]